MGSNETVLKAASFPTADLPREHVAQCESIRGVAILLVFIFHFLGDVYGYQEHPEATYVSSLFLGGDTGVTLFFVLSGFLLTLPFFKGAPLRIGVFYRNRALRILPMYYLMVLFAGWWTGQWHYVPSALLFQELKLEALFPMGAVWWSLVVEIQFYLILPCLVLMAQRPLQRWLLLGVLAVGVYVYWQVGHAEPGAPTGWGNYRNSLLGRWPLFAVGAALAWIHVRFGAGLREGTVAARRWPGLLVLSLAVLLLVAVIHRRVTLMGAALPHWFWYDHYLLEALCWGLFLFALLHLRPLGSALVVNPLLHRLGLWSYSLYLVHATVLFLVGGRVARAIGPLRESPVLVVLTGVGLLALSCVISALTYRLVERPFLDLKKRRQRPLVIPAQG